MFDSAGAHTSHLHRYQDPFELRFFNAFELGAQAAPLPSPGGITSGRTCWLSAWRLGESLLVQRRRMRSGASPGVALRYGRRIRRWPWRLAALRYPDLEDACQLRFVEMVCISDFPGRALTGGDGVPPASIAYVCVDSLALVALALHESLSRDVPIISMARSPGRGGSRGDDTA